jgi:hypothetical protein
LRRRIVAFAAELFGVSSERVTLEGGDAVAGADCLQLAKVVRQLPLSVGG